jgi:hypothetical protein
VAIFAVLPACADSQPASLCSTLIDNWCRLVNVSSDSIQVPSVLPPCIIALRCMPLLTDFGSGAHREDHTNPPATAKC